MQKKSTLFITLCSLTTALLLNSAHADIEWSGVYRIEGNFLKNSELGSKGKELTYGLHHLVLRPKIVAGDGLTIYGQFDILNNKTYPNSQMGQVFGSGVRLSAASDTTSVGNSNSVSQTHASDTVQVTQLYLTYSQEYGQLIMGRAPLHFGLGMTHNAGRGLFDHWYDTRDLVGFKFILGPMWFLPMLGKPSEGALNQNDDVNDFMLQFQYEIPDEDLELGFFAQNRRGGSQSSDAPTPAVADPAGSVLGGAGATNTGGANMKQYSFYALKDSSDLRFGIEATFQSGESGVMTTSGDNVTWDAFGIAGELEYRPEASNWNWALRAGTATGDDPTTDAKFEGFIFDRNYDVAMLMFNHPLGQDDFLRTRLVTGAVRDANSNIALADVEAVSNAFYISPSAKYRLSEHWTWNNSLTAGFLNTDPIINKSIGKDLGYEWDTSMSYSPRKGLTWVTQAGLLFPGSAWEGDAQYDSSFAFGLTTKAAISF